MLTRSKLTWTLWSLGMIGLFGSAASAAVLNRTPPTPTPLYKLSGTLSATASVWSSLDGIVELDCAVDGDFNPTDQQSWLSDHVRIDYAASSIGPMYRTVIGATTSQHYKVGPGGKLTFIKSGRISVAKDRKAWRFDIPVRDFGITLKPGESIRLDVRVIGRNGVLSLSTNAPSNNPAGLLRWTKPPAYPVVRLLDIPLLPIGQDLQTRGIVTKMIGTTAYVQDRIDPVAIKVQFGAPVEIDEADDVVLNGMVIGWKQVGNAQICRTLRSTRPQPIRMRCGDIRQVVGGVGLDTQYLLVRIAGNTTDGILTDGSGQIRLSHTVPNQTGVITTGIVDGSVFHIVGVH